VPALLATPTVLCRCARGRTSGSPTPRKTPDDVVSSLASAATTFADFVTRRADTADLTASRSAPSLQGPASPAFATCLPDRAAFDDECTRHSPPAQTPRRAARQVADPARHVLATSSFPLRPAKPGVKALAKSSDKGASTARRRCRRRSSSTRDEGTAVAFDQPAFVLEHLDDTTPERPARRARCPPARAPVPGWDRYQRPRGVLQYSTTRSGTIQHVQRHNGPS